MLTVDINTSRSMTDAFVPGIRILSVTALAFTLSLFTAEVIGADVRKQRETTYTVTKVDSIAALLPQSIAKSGQISVVGTGDQPPLEYIDERGEVQGLRRELFDEAAKVLGVKLKYTHGTFDSLIPGLKARRYDVLLALNDFKERQAQVDFVDYIDSGVGIMGRTGKGEGLKALTDACGLTVAYQKGTPTSKLEAASKNCVAAGKKALTITAYPEFTTCILAVKSARADLAYGNTNALYYNASKEPSVFQVYFEDPLGPQGAVFAKDNAQLRDAFQAAFTHLQKIGVYDKVVDSYGMTKLRLKEFTINAGPALKDLGF
jgi:polar amino acid transport system substrate-binding protein